ncbi:SIR2 family protein [Sulfurimonas sp.]|uniref:SIR2 family protein n=1 Tax=Sulfurimonas sp. TaxID=2022749 RepID=UPI0025E084DA|nr:SIR2 family protein [Sulfurimonas sp.]MCK9454841.1 SIR2 family protein [Sulfurimonas sp.]
MSEEVVNENIKFYQGLDELSKSKSDVDSLKLIKQKIFDLSNMKNIHFLFGSGTSTGTKELPAIPTMKDFIVKIEAKLTDEPKQITFKKLKDNNNENLEDVLGILYSKRDYQLGIKEADKDTDELIKVIEETIFKEINIDFSAASCEAVADTYKTFYQKVTYRNKDLSRVNIFTTNNDLFNERVLDNLNINYNNGFGGGLERFFNPARFGYTFSKKIETSIEKYEALDNMIYLYKLHGSINWIEKEGNSLFNIQEINIKHTDKKPSESVLIYPNPLKQSKSLTSPYTDIIREFQKKLLLQNSVLFVIGYSFSDDHLNNIIYQALSSNSSISIVIFGNYDKPIYKIDDKRIYKIHGEIESEKIHYFKYIVDEFIPNLNENKDSNILKEFMQKLSETKEKEL